MASFTVPCPKASPLDGFGSIAQKNSHEYQHKQKLWFSRRGFSNNASLSSGSSLGNPAFSRFEGPNKKKSAGLIAYAQLNKVDAEKSSNSTPPTPSSLATASVEGKDEPVKEFSGQKGVPDASSISAFMTQVSDLLKLVDSRDIMELQLKQLDCEIIIRKKEALQPPAPVAPIATMQPAMYHLPPPPTPAAAFAPAHPPAPAPASPAPAKISSPSHPPLKSPMAGTFYRSPAPGEPPFVKVGSKVQKGQVICIIEAMKLMNEIEADQSGTITEILLEDGKPVSVDTPLFVIAP